VRETSSLKKKKKNERKKELKQFFLLLVAIQYVKQDEDVIALKDYAQNSQYGYFLSFVLYEMLTNQRRSV